MTFVLMSRRSCFFVSFMFWKVGIHQSGISEALCVLVGNFATQILY